MNQLLPEVRVVVSGEVQSRYGIQLAAKSIEVIDDRSGDEGPHAGRFVPVYPVNKNIQTRRMRTLIHRALDAAGRILDPLPAEVLVRHEPARSARRHPRGPLPDGAGPPARRPCAVSSSTSSS